MRAPGGWPTLIAQWHPPAWFDALVAGEARTAPLGDITGSLDPLSIVDGVLTAEMVYRSGSDVWTQRFTARRLTIGELHRDLAASGLRFDRWLSADRHWFTARPGDAVPDGVTQPDAAEAERADDHRHPESGQAGRGRPRGSLHRPAAPARVTVTDCGPGRRSRPSAGQ